MIQLKSQKEAQRRGLPSAQVQSISPYLNPAHVLSPPRYWLEALEQGEFNWPFFRWRYKTMLRKRFRDEPSRFHAILSASEGNAPLTLTCHCLGQHGQGQRCHAPLAREFLENLREQIQAEPLPKHQRPRRIAPAGEVSLRRQPGVEVAMLIEHPNQASPVHS
ncbi:MAG: hypothetical protein IIC13_06690 [SAR324 cluster bacterium]|nr:hypothetical protein [SAR324 cluster bacterium]MCH8886260.1 hypothetical protein [SAR324 cluster bacterium]